MKLPSGLMNSSKRLLTANSLKSLPGPRLRLSSTLALQPTPPLTASKNLSNTPQALPFDAKIDEEESYQFVHQIKCNVVAGDLLNDRYRNISRVGFGSSPCLWVAQDMKAPKSRAARYVTLKNTSSSFTRLGLEKHELNISKSVAIANPVHEGAECVRNITGNFDSFDTNSDSWYQCGLPLALVKQYVACLLKVLEYLHDECQIVHTNLTPDNIMMGFSNSSTLQTFLAGDLRRQFEHDPTIYELDCGFSPLGTEILPVFPKISGFNRAQRMESDLKTEHIQSAPYIAPEPRAWNLLQGDNLFSTIHSREGLGLKYEARRHLAQMIALLGHPPKEVVDCRISRGVTVHYGGPFFDADGEFLFKNLIPKGVTLNPTVSFIEGNERHAFLDFVCKMLRWVPEERMTAKELLDEPWLQDSDMAVS